jgi:formylglycine-generating enzyme required for sulfatase activity
MPGYPILHKLQGSIKAAILSAALLMAALTASCSAISQSSTSAAIDSLLSDDGYVRIPPGSFLMGSPEDAEHRKRLKAGGLVDELINRERPRRCVVISAPFQMGKHEVTQEQWEAVMESNPSAFKGPGLPVTNVSWYDAQDFIKRLQAIDPGHEYRLPTEAEWEYACRAVEFAGAVESTVTGASPGEYVENLKQAAWFSDNSLNRPRPAGQLNPNAWGLHDMLGNVREWCQDWYDPGYYKDGESVDPRGPGIGEMKINRGGSWQSQAYFCRPAMRGHDLPTERNFLIGFRLARVMKL